MAPRVPLIFFYALILVLIPHAAQAQSAERAGEVAEINRSGLQLHEGRTAWLDQGDDVIGPAGRTEPGRIAKCRPRRTILRRLGFIPLFQLCRHVIVQHVRLT